VSDPARGQHRKVWGARKTARDDLSEHTGLALSGITFHHNSVFMNS